MNGSTMRKGPNPRRGNTLVVGFSRREFARLASSLDDDGRLDRIPSAAGALELTSRVPFELLLVRSPLRDMTLNKFLDRVRSPGGPCKQSPLMLLCPEKAAKAEWYVGRGADRAICLEDEATEIRAAISSLLAAASRRASRFKVRLRVELSNFLDKILCRTENVSASGMLIKTRQRFDPGTRIRFDFSLPADDRAINGIGEVVRHTEPGRDPVGGLALRNLSFAGHSQQRFEAYLQSL